MRTDVITALKTQLENISIANGYETQSGNDVRLWDVFNSEDDKLPFIEIADKDADVQVDVGIWHHTLDIQIRIFTKDVDNARKAINDVLTSLGNNEYLDSSVDSMIVLRHEIDQEASTGNSAMAIVEIRVRYPTNEWAA